MSRTLKDAPGARRSRRDRRFAERPFGYEPSAVFVPSDGLSAESLAAAADWLGLPGTPAEAELAAAPCPHSRLGILELAVLDPDPGSCCVPADVMVRAELTAYANDGW